MLNDPPRAFSERLSICLTYVGFGKRFVLCSFQLQQQLLQQIKKELSRTAVYNIINNKQRSAAIYNHYYLPVMHKNTYADLNSPVEHARYIPAVIILNYHDDDGRTNTEE